MSTINFSLLPIEKVDAGTVIIEEGTKLDKVYVLKEGAVSIKCGGDEVCQESNPETFFGEISKLLNKEATATVETTEDSSFYIIHDLKKFSTINPEVAFIISERLSERLIKMNELFIEIKKLASEKKDSSSNHGKIHDLIVKFDKFLSPLERDVFHPFSTK